MWVRPASVFLFLFATARGLLAQSSASDPTALLAELPSCALPCLISVLTSPTSPCPLASFNQTCICESDELQTEMSACILTSCSVKDALTTVRVSNGACGVPVRNRQSELVVSTTVLLLLALITIGIRFYVKIFVGEGSSAGGLSAIGADDWFILATVLFGIPSVLLTCLGAVRHGLGRDIWTLSESDITQFAKYLFVLQICYVAAVPSVKASLLFFYLRIFPARPIRRLLWATIALNGAYAITFICLAAFVCQPISFFWEGWDGEHEGFCLNRNLITWIHAGIGIALDFWMLAIPLSQLHVLKMHWKKKVGVGLMFVVGSFITMVSILRLNSLVKFGGSVNATWDSLSASVWSAVELSVGMICTCLPTVRILIVRLFPIMGGTTMRSGNAGNTGSNKPSNGQSSFGSNWSRSRGWSISKESKANLISLDTNGSAGLSNSNSVQQLHRLSIGGGRIIEPAPAVTTTETQGVTAVTRAKSPMQTLTDQVHFDTPFCDTKGEFKGDARSQTRSCSSRSEFKWVGRMRTPSFGTRAESRGRNRMRTPSVGTADMPQSGGRVQTPSHRMRDEPEARPSPSFVTMAEFRGRDRMRAPSVGTRDIPQSGGRVQTPSHPMRDEPEYRPAPPPKSPGYRPKGPGHYHSASMGGSVRSSGKGPAPYRSTSVVESVRASSRGPASSRSHSVSVSSASARGPGHFHSASVGSKSLGAAVVRALSSSWELEEEDFDSVYHDIIGSLEPAQSPSSGHRRDHSRDHVALHVRKPPPTRVIRCQKSFHVSYSENNGDMDEAER